MKKIIKLLPLFILVLSINQAEAQKSWNEIEYPPLNSFEKPDVEIFELDNGITFYLVEDDELPLINLRVMVRTGGVLVPNAKTGLQTIAGTVMRTGGTTSISGDELNELLEDRAARMETGMGLSSGSASMNVLKEDFTELLPVFIDLLQNPAFPENRIELAKTQQKSGITRRNDETIPVGLREFQKLIYGGESVYARNTEFATIDNITREDLIEFHRSSFVGNNMMIGVIGDFNTEEMKEQLTAAFQAIPAGSETELNFPAVNYDYVNTINFVDKRDVNQSFVMMGHIGGLRENPDYAKIQVMNRILSDGFSGRLMRIIRGQMGLAYSVFGEYGSGNFFPGIFYAGVMTQSETTADAINAILEQIQRLQDEPVSEQELKDVIDRFLNSLVFEYDSRASVLNERMSYDYAGLDPDTFDRLVEEIQAVTIEDVQEVAQKYLRPEALQILVVGNGEELGDQLAQFGDVNEVDITIPRPEREDAGAMAGDLEAGSEWLGRMAAELTDGEDFTTLTMTGTGSQGGMNFDTETEIRFPGYLRQVINTQMGSQTILYENGSAKVIMGEAEQPVPQLNNALRSSIQRHYLNVALTASELEASYLGEEDVEGTMTAKIYIPEYEVTFYVDPETGFPVMSTYEEMNPQTGEFMSVSSHYYDWTESEGVWVAYRTVEKADGNEISSGTVSSHSVE